MSNKATGDFFKDNHTLDENNEILTLSREIEKTQTEMKDLYNQGNTKELKKKYVLLTSLKYKQYNLVNKYGHVGGRRRKSRKTKKTKQNLRKTKRRR